MIGGLRRPAALPVEYSSMNTDAQPYAFAAEEVG
jgi:hypothetical protein